MRQIAVAAVGRADSLADVVRPFLWIAAISFTAGFWGYLSAAPLLRR
jgi:hypothetical protein